MRPDLEQYYLIDQYLENKLKGEELISFENQLSKDELFLTRVEEQRKINDLILEAELKSVRTQIERDLAFMQNPSFFRMHWKWVSVGVISILGILYFSLLNKNIQSQPEQKHLNNAIGNYQSTNQASVSGSKKTQKFTQGENDAIQKTNSTNITHENTLNDIAVAADSVTNTETIKPILPIETGINASAKTEVNDATIHSVHDCSLIKISCSISTEPSCANTQTGSIYIEKISGGIAPYSLTLNKKKVKEKNISELAGGIYTVKITDKNGCYTEHQATVLEKNCISAIQQGPKFNINPSIGETCVIPFDTNKKGNLIIYHRSGKIIYRSTNQDREYIEWNGTDGYGALAETGLYVYIIEYEDETKISGEVNITR